MRGPMAKLGCAAQKKEGIVIMHEFFDSVPKAIDYDELIGVADAVRYYVDHETDGKGPRDEGDLHLAAEVLH